MGPKEAKDVFADGSRVIELGTATENAPAIKTFLGASRQELNIVKTTTTKDGLTIDWIPLDSQGTVADPPQFAPATPTLPFSTSDGTTSDAAQPQPDVVTPTSLVDEDEISPLGIVPILRHGTVNILGRKTLDQYLAKELPPNALGHRYQETAYDLEGPDPFRHHWAGSYQDVTHYGSNGCYSCFDPFVQDHDSESLIQTGVLNITPGREMQAIEVGWQVLPELYGDHLPHLFTYYRTKGSAVGHNIGGYNRLVKGWVQVDKKIMPGSTFKPLNVSGNASKQYQIHIAVQLIHGNWWVWVQGRWIGYYPAKLFSAVDPGASDTLANHGNRLGFWGEIADSTKSKIATRTDMGSGHFPDKGFGWSAYMNKLSYLDTPAGDHSVWYDGSAIVYAADPTLYRIVPHFRPVDAHWGSYVFVGGPGAARRPISTRIRHRVSRLKSSLKKQPDHVSDQGSDH